MRHVVWFFLLRGRAVRSAPPPVRPSLPVSAVWPQSEIEMERITRSPRQRRAVMRPAVTIGHRTISRKFGGY